MHWETLIGADELAARLDACVVVDCRHELLDPTAGRQAYAEAHIPGAFFLHQDEDLAGARTGRNGRHPLPDADSLRARLAALGLDDDRQLVAYDAATGATAGRLWWLARWLGHRRVAVLDGGIAAWRGAGYPVTGAAAPTPASASLTRRPSLAPARDAAEIVADLAARQYTIVDARGAERYEGRSEPIDPVAGHIPGSINRPFQANLRPDGRFKPAPVLRAEFLALLGSRAPDAVVHSCGSGVSACHNLIAMEHAGLVGSALYPGSWSEWCADPKRPVATGTSPG